MNYQQAVNKVLATGIPEINQRTKEETKRLFGQTIEYADGWIFSPRECNPGISAAELAWMLSGTRDTTWMKKYCKIWNKFEDAPDWIESAYGYRWRYSFSRDQIRDVMSLLKKDSSTRQGLVLAWDPRIDGLMNQGAVKNVPCPFAFNLYICNGNLKIVVYQRSADLIAGVPYDLMTYWLLGKGFADSLGIPFTGVSILFGDLHIYHSHYETANKIIESIVPGNTKNMPQLQSACIEEMENDPDGFVRDNWSLWNGLFAFKERVQVAQ